MVDEKLREYLAAMYDDQMILFDNPAFDHSIVGINITQEGDKAVYSYEKMVTEYMEDNDCDVDTAIEFIDYNTLGSLSYIDGPEVIITHF